MYNFQDIIKNNILDLVISKAITKKNICEVLPGLYISDYLAVQVSIQINREQQKKETIIYQDIKNKSAQNIFEKVNLRVEDFDHVDNIVEHLDKQIDRALNEVAPKCEKTVQIRKKQPWYDTSIKRQKTVMRNREKIWRKYETPETWMAFDVEKRRYNTLLRQSKEESIKCKVVECKNNTKKLYKLISNITGTTKVNPLPEAISDKELADKFAIFFYNKIVDIRNKLDVFDKYEPARREISYISEFQPVTCAEVRKIPASMTNKSCELDVVNTKFLKEGMDYILQEITDLVNFSLQYGQFLRKWKTSKVRPMIKKINSCNLDLTLQNFRPINNVNFLSNALEKIALNQIMKHCDSLMLDCQSAYRKFYSCETVLVKLVNDILWAMEHQKILSLVCIDLSAAFDIVDHEILEQVLKNEYGINGTVLQWYKTYIRPRGFKVNIHEEYSDERELPFAVAQASCMGPYLFVLYCITIKYNVPRTISLLGYSDDHALKDTFNAKNRDDENRCVGEMEDYLKDVNIWMCKSRLKMNNGKTEFIYFGSRQMLSLCEREKNRCTRYKNQQVQQCQILRSTTGF